MLVSNQMEKIYLLNSIHLIDTQYYNPYRAVYKHIPLRNKIKFYGKDKFNILSFINKNLYNIINTPFFDQEAYFEIQVNKIGEWALIIIGNIDLTTLNTNKLIYFNYNKDIIINNSFFEYIYNIKIKRSINSFHQNDDSIRYTLYNCMKKYLTNKNVLFVGGEAYIFGCIFNVTKCYCFSDYQSIIDDCIDNNLSCSLVDYNKCKLPIRDIIVFNNGKKGLTDNLINECNKNKYKLILIVSCNEKAFINDLSLLKYNLQQRYIIETNYQISLNVLS